MRMLGVIVAFTFVVVGLSLEASADWSRFRGHDGVGVDDRLTLPGTLGPDDSLVWRVEIPQSSSSPILSGDAVYVTASDDDALLVMRLDARSGKVDWKREVARARTSKIHVQNDSASPTPVVDGENLYAFFQELGVVSFTLDGKHRWTVPLEPFTQFYGMSGSPVVTKDLVLLQCDQQQSAYLIAIEKNDGTVRWKTDRSIRGSSWTTPLVFPSVGNAHAVILHGNGYLDAYSLDSGAHLWGLPGYGSTPTTSPFSSGDRVYTTAAPSTEPDGSGFQLQKLDAFFASHDANGDEKVTKEELKGNILAGEFGWGDMDDDGFITSEEYSTIYEEFHSDDYGLTAVKLDADHPETEPQMLWRYRGHLPYITTPLLYRDTLFFVDQKGYVSTIDAGTGELVKRERVPDMRGQVYASPVAGDGKVYIAAMNGKVAVLSGEAEWEVLSVNDLDERITATPAIGNGHLYVRTKQALYCFGESF